MITPTAVAKIQQQHPSLTSDGQRAEMISTRAGQLFTAGWKTELVLAGYAYNVTVGTIVAGGDVSLVTGGGAGTVIDTDQPELAIGTPTGYFHIPLSFRATIQADHDADADEGNIVLFADQTQTVPTSATATAATITPLLDGGQTSVSTGWHTVTGDITDPVCTQLLGYATNVAAQIDASATAISALRLDYVPGHPVLLKGPCSVVAAWGGTAAVTGACTYCWAEVPIGRYE
jgi:hypothetical protein